MLKLTRFSSASRISALLHINKNQSGRFATTTASTISEPTTENVLDEDLASAKPFDEVPGYKSLWERLKVIADFLPVIGKNYGKSFNLHNVHHEQYKTFGEIVRISLAKNAEFVLLYNPDDIKKVFRHEGPHPRRTMLYGLEYYRKSLPNVYDSSGILIENGKKWHDIRSGVQVPMLRPLVVETYLPKMDDVAIDFIHHMKSHRDSKQEIPHFLNELYKWALESVGLVAFNARLGCLNKNLAADSETQKLINAANDSMENIAKLEFGVHFWKYVPSKAYDKLAAAQQIFANISDKYFNKTVEEVKQHPSDKARGGVIGQYIREGKLSQKDIKTFMQDMLAAGIDTTSHTMAFTLYLLARNPEAQEKAYQEISRVVPSKESNLSVELLNKLPYMQACVKESMRLATVVEGTGRILDHDIALSGYRIPAGVQIILLTQVASCLPKNFENPMSYMPERWLDRTKKPHPCANLPFGYGPRMCIGQRLAVQELQLLLTKILQNFKVEYHYEDINRLTRFVSMPDKPLKFSFVDRK